MADVSPAGSPDPAVHPQAADPGATPPSDHPTTPAAADPVAPAPGGQPAAPVTGPVAPVSGPVAPVSGPVAQVAPVSGPPGRGDEEPTAAWTAAMPPVTESTSAAVAEAPPHLPEAATTVPPVPGRPNGWRRWAPITGVFVLIAAAAIALLIYLGINIGITGLAVGLAAAVLPVPLLAASFAWLDRYEPEPVKYLIFCFAWGAAIATGVSLIVNRSGALLFERLGLPDALVAVLVAPFIEESMKALGPMLLFWLRRTEWSGITDGIVYCGLSALGFAMVENVLYLGGHGYAAGADEYGPATGLTNVFAIFIVRILFTGFAHPLFTAMTGIGLGIAARSADGWVRRLAPLAGLLLAMILHGLFNLLPTLTAATGEPLIMLYGFLGFMVPFFFAVVGFAIALRSWEGRLTERVLPFYVRTGWFAPPEVAALGSLGRRHSARHWAKRVAGPAGQRAMRNFQFAATRLALIRDGMQRGLVQHSAVDEERQLLAAIGEYRSVFTGRDPQTPPGFWDGENYRITFPDGVTRTVAAPPEPVMPVPVRLAQQPIPAYAGGYGQPYPQAGYGAAPGYPQPGYGAAPGYPQPGYGAAPGYPQPGYGAAPSYPPPGYGGAPSYPPAGYGAAPQSGYSAAPQSADGGAPGYPQSGHPATPGHPQHGHGGAPGYPPPGYAAGPSYPPPGYAGAPGYPPPGNPPTGYGSPYSPPPGGPEPSPYAPGGHAGPPPFPPAPGEEPPTGRPGEPAADHSPWQPPQP